MSERLHARDSAFDIVPDDPDALADLWLMDAWAQTPREFRVESDGASIACRGWNLDRTDLPGIVLVHGFRAHARWWDHIGPLLAEDHRVVAFDFSGMGDSDRRDAYSRLLHAREILATADGAGFDRFIVAAHSYGGIAALIAAADAPERVSRAIIIDSALPTEEDKDRPNGASPQRIYPDFDTAVSRFRLIPPGRWPNRKILGYIGHHSVRPIEGGWTWKFDEAIGGRLNPDDDVLQKLGRITIPVDFVYGDRSEIVTPRRLALIPQMMPHAGKPVAIPSCHHHCMIERPLELVTALRALFSKAAA